jgi:hypothetical protein
MGSCRDVQSLMAASLYEPLEAPEDALLKAHVDACASCASEYAELRALVDAVPAEPIDFAGDLRPVLREALRRKGTWRHTLRRLFVLESVGLLAVCASVYWFSMEGAEVENTLQVASSPVDVVLTEARSFAKSGQLAEARLALEKGLSDLPNNPEVGQIHLELANFEFEHLHRYEEAYGVYVAVRERHPETWVQSSGAIKDRFDLLVEAQDDNFEPLYKIDAARSHGESGIEDLESLITRYPGRMLADAAVTTMVDLVEGDGVDALESLKARCTDPLAVAQLDVRLGEGYWRERQDPQRGRELLETVVESGYEIPAEMARATLARLEMGEE